MLLSCDVKLAVVPLVSSSSIVCAIVSFSDDLLSAVSSIGSTFDGSL